MCNDGQVEYSAVDISDSDAPYQRRVQQKETPPAREPGVLREGVLVSVAVMVAVAFFLFGRLLDDRRLGGEHHSGHRRRVQHG